jgi:hypothetical protein
MRALRWIFIALAALVAIVIGVGFLLPSEFNVERSIVIGADPARIHTLVGDLERWPEWTPWQEMDPTIRTFYSERTTGVGAGQNWTGESGNGELVFTGCDPETGVEYEITFTDANMRSVGALVYEPLADGTRVTWRMGGDAEMNLISRYFGLFMDSLVGDPFEAGLANLKAVAEASGTPAEVAAAGNRTESEAASRDDSR